MNDKFFIELVWHNCKTHPPEEEYNDSLFMYDGKNIHKIEYNKQMGWWSWEIDDFIKSSELYNCWWADIQHTLKKQSNCRRLNINRKISYKKCMHFINNVLRINLCDYQKEIIKCFCEGKEVLTGRCTGRSMCADAYGKYITHLLKNNDYQNKPDIVIANTSGIYIDEFHLV